MKKLKEKLSMLEDSIKRIALLLCLLMTVRSSILSQDTSKIIITSDQLRTANLIFAEHKQYSQLVPLLQKENLNLQTINQTWVRTDSIKSAQLYQKNQIISEQFIDMDRMRKTIKIGGTVTGVSVLITVLCLILR